jgi:hypothetical protein
MVTLYKVSALVYCSLCFRMIGIIVFVYSSFTDIALEYCDSFLEESRSLTYPPLP